MKVTVTTLADEIFVLDVSEDLELKNFKAFCEVESGHPARDILIVHEGKPLLDGNLSLKSHGVKDGDVVILQHIQPAQRGSMPSLQCLNPVNLPDGFTATNPMFPNLDFSTIQVPQSGPSTPSSIVGASPSVSRMDDPVRLRELFLANPDQLALLKQNNPRLADALHTVDEFAKVLKEQIGEREKREAQRAAMMSADPFDVEAQRLIADEIKMKNIQANMEAAMEYNPETFGSVIMLYINCRVNGHDVKAFVDSGAQTTIMSSACAERVNVMRLVDTRWGGIARGVGVQRIIGRIHMVQVAIENDFLTTSFSVLEEQPIDMLLGLDMLRRHECCIDLKRNVLRIGTTGTETRFLSESELPAPARLTMAEEAMNFGPSPVAGQSSSSDLPSSASNLSSSARSKPGNTSSVELDHLLNILPSDKFNENDVKEIVSYGFARQQAISELRRFDGDKKQATAALFAKSLKF